MSPEQTKHDPCRLFREGDIVSPCEHNGRPAWGSTPNLSQIKPIEGNYKVFRDELHGNVIINYKYGYLTISHSHLKLITPVKETNPYSVEEDTWYWRVLEEQNGVNVTICKFAKDFHPYARAAAETECARLNAKHRKEQNNETH